MSPGALAEWRERVCSTVHALLITAGSLLCFREWTGYEPPQEAFISNGTWSRVAASKTACGDAGSLSKVLVRPAPTRLGVQQSGHAVPSVHLSLRTSLLLLPSTWRGRIRSPLPRSSWATCTGISAGCSGTRDPRPTSAPSCTTSSWVSIAFDIICVITG